MQKESVSLELFQCSSHYLTKSTFLYLYNKNNYFLPIYEKGIKQIHFIKYLLNWTQVTLAPRFAFLPGVMGLERLFTSQISRSQSTDPVATKLLLKRNQYIYILLNHIVKVKLWAQFSMEINITTFVYHYLITDKTNRMVHIHILTSFTEY